MFCACIIVSLPVMSRWLTFGPKEPTRKLDVVVTVRRLAIGVVDDPDEKPPR